MPPGAVVEASGCPSGTNTAPQSPDLWSGKGWVLGAIFGVLYGPRSRRLALGLPEPERASPVEEAEEDLRGTLGQKF